MQYCNGFIIRCWRNAILTCAEKNGFKTEYIIDRCTNISDPFDESAFELYNLSDDMAETNDLSKSNPEKFSEMMNEWVIFKKKAGVISKEKGAKSDR